MKALILEDEQLSAKRLGTMIAQANDQITVVDVIHSVKDAIAYFEKNEKPDLIFSDIQLSDDLAFEIFEKYDLKTPIIFTTAFSEYAVKAIKLSAIDYLLKPIGPRELNKAIDKAIQAINKENADLNRSMEVLSYNLNSSNKCKKILINDLRGCSIINIDEILKCQSDKNYTTFHLEDGRKIISSKTLKEYDEILPSNQFVRVHNSFLVNINHIIRYLKGEGGSIIMKDGSEVEVSRRKKTDLLSALSFYQ